MTGKGERLLSIDALRGFDMFWITGGAAFVTVLARFCGADDSSWIVRQMSHVPWVGFHHHDTIFPLFLFLAGVSWPYSLANRRGKGWSDRRICAKVVFRFFILALLGMSFEGLLDFKSNFRIPSVLGYIGASWAVAAIAFMYVKDRFRPWLAPVALVLYEIILLSFTAATDPAGVPVAAGANHFAAETNVIGWLDRVLLRTHICAPWGDPESFFSLPGGVAMALIGMNAGTLLRRDDLGGGAKALRLLLLAAVALAATCVFVFLLGTPVVKSLWSPSFVLAAAVYSLAMLALFYWIVDVLGFRRWTLYFKVIGMNSILAYVLMMIGAVRPFKSYLFRGVGNAVPIAIAPTVNALAMLISFWLVLYFFYRKKVFLKV